MLQQICSSFLMIGDLSISVPHHILIKRKKLNYTCRCNVKKGNAPGTRANHRTHYNSYLKFCDEYRFNPLPADDWRYCQYAQHLAWENKVPGTIENYVSTVWTVHRLENLYCPGVDQIHYKKLTESFKKQREVPVKQAAAMTHEVLMQIFPHVNLDSELEAVTWVSLLVGFCLVLRVSNLAPVSRFKFDHAQNLLRSDLYMKQGFWTLKIRWSKTIQNHNKILESPLVPSKYREICPQHWVTRMMRIIPARPDEPFFLVRSKEGRLPLSIGQISRLLNKWTKKAGLDPKPYMAHCLHRGGLNWAHRAKLTGETLRLLSDWGNEAYLHYIDHDFETRVRAGEAMAEIVDHLM